MKNLLKRIIGHWKDNVPALNRIQTAIWVRENSVNDFFGGWEVDDLPLLEKYKPTVLPTPTKGEIIDWLGIKTAASIHSWLKLPDAGYLVIDDLPVPDDMVHAETIEYIALTTSLERAIKHGQDSFTAVELGASYAPWAIASGVLGVRKGFSIKLLALEANANMIPRIIDHAERNNLFNNENIQGIPIHGAISVQDGVVYFPKVNVENDNGAQITQDPKSIDYRGLSVEHEAVKAYSLKSLLANFERVDFLHMDVQGAEAELLSDKAFLDTMTEKVATFFLATQSRLIEGIALEKLSRLGWRIIRERPTIYKQNDRTADINGWTLRDGGQLWLNLLYGE